MEPHKQRGSLELLYHSTLHWSLLVFTSWRDVRQRTSHGIPADSGYFC
ncbi:rCG57143 [Rattus norvegicus]|uniref:RCG57143 n=1 Tax=Rattus norvegicus TaxID=10116 RepID=A6JDG9_RAT|nr:rCG57143 [Rattus norvegicus]